MYYTNFVGAQWHSWLCVSLGIQGFTVVCPLSKTLYLLLSIGSTQEDRKSPEHDWKIVDWDLIAYLKTNTTIFYFTHKFSFQCSR